MAEKQAGESSELMHLVILISVVVLCELCTENVRRFYIFEVVMRCLKENMYILYVGLALMNGFNQWTITLTSFAQYTGRSLEGKVAIVTGASSGIGKAIAVSLAAAGARVAMAARRTDRLQEVQTTIAQNGGIAISVTTDVTNRDNVRDQGSSIN